MACYLSILIEHSTILADPLTQYVHLLQLGSRSRHFLMLAPGSALILHEHLTRIQQESRHLAYCCAWNLHTSL